MGTAVSTEVLEAKPSRWVRYNPAFCDDVIQFMAQGLTKTAWAGHIGIHRGTLYEWRDSYPDFAEALKIGVAKYLLYWERKHIDITDSGEGMIVGSIFALKNADPTDPEGWRDRHEVIGVAPPKQIDETIIAQRVAYLLMQGITKRE